MISYLHLCATAMSVNRLPRVNGDMVLLIAGCCLRSRSHDFEFLATPAFTIPTNLSAIFDVMLTAHCRLFCRILIFCRCLRIVCSYTAAVSPVGFTKRWKISSPCGLRCFSYVDLHWFRWPSLQESCTSLARTVSCHLTRSIGVLGVMDFFHRIYSIRARSVTRALNTIDRHLSLPAVWGN